MLRLKQLKVKGVRGIVHGPDLHFQDGGLLLCGDNGTGKSSYIDALEKVISGHCSSLDKSGHNVSWNKQGHHIECDSSEIELIITDGNKDSIITLTSDPSTLDNNAQLFLEAAQEQSFVLRRRTLLDFIDAVPNQRYTAIGNFLRLEEYSNFEVKLKELLKEVKGNVKACNDAIEQQDHTLKTQLDVKLSQGINDTLCIKLANEILDDAQITKLGALDELPNKIYEIEKQLLSFSNVESFQKIQGLTTSISNIPEDAIEELLNDYINERKKVSEEEEKLKGHFYVDILKKSLAWIEEDKLEKCPVCNNDIKIEATATFIKARLKENEKFIQLNQNLSNSQTKLLKSLQNYQIALTDVKNRWEGVFESEFQEKPNNLIEGIEKLIRSIESSFPIPNIESLVLKFNYIDIPEILNSLNSKVKSLLDNLPDNIRYNQLINHRDRLKAISNHTIMITSLTEKLNGLTICEDQLEILSSIAEKGRKNAVQKLLNAVVDIADQYFQQIHPGEQIGKPELIIPERGSGSIELTGQFHSTSGDPRGHYSEGHVDSLGLCLFLAIRRLSHTQRPELSLLVLDDIMHSVDANHRQNTANLIFKEFSDHQIIITTHDPLWFEYLKIASKKGGHNFAQKRISMWTLETGPIWGDHLSNYEWLISNEEKYAKPADKVNKAGLLLEEMLQNICNNLTISVPFKIKGDYTIDPLWNSFYSVAKKNKGFLAVSEKCLQNIDDLRNLRNWVGAHWNEWAQSLTAFEAEAFVNSVIELRNYIYCDTCNQFIIRISELEGVWACKNECIRYKK